jgi:DNA (cytosine-5)-methyltransferase 1
MLGELGYGFAYRILDAQYFGVPQRRRRVFVVGYIGDWRRAAAVLFESESLLGNPPPSRSERQSVAGNPLASSSGNSRGYADRGPGGDSTPVCYDMRGNGGDGTVPTITGDHAGRPTDYTPIVMAHGQANAEISEGNAPTLNCNHEAPILALAGNTIGREPENGGNGCGYQEDLSYTLTKTDEHGVMQGSTVRRLTPVECERLQGFPDNWTRIPWRGATAENCPDGPRYKACGNSMAVPVMRWIGERISKYE